MIRILIIADSPARGQRMADLLAEDDRFEIVGVRTSSGLRSALASFVDVAVASGVSPDEVPADAPIVLLDGSHDLTAFDDRVRALLPANPSAQELIGAASAAAAGLTSLTEEQAHRWLPGRQSRRTHRDPLLEPLTARELQILRMLSDGLGNKEIAGQLAISDHTVKFHVAQILAKLSASSRTEAVMIAVRRGLIPI